MRRLVMIFGVLLVARSLSAAPPEAFSAALADCEKLPPDVRRRTRYLDATELLAATRKTDVQVGVFWLNMLNRSGPYHPVVIGDPPVVVRIDLDELGWWGDPKDPSAGQAVWERLKLTEAQEVYFHRGEERKLSDGRVERVMQRATWLPGPVREIREKDGTVNHVDELAAMTGTWVPIVRLDWFLWITGRQADRGPPGQTFGYYDFNGFRSLADFFEAIGADSAKSRKFGFEASGRVQFSGVTIFPRAVNREQTISGGHWFTWDFRSDKGRKNALVLLNRDTDPPTGDGSRQIGFGRSGLFKFAVVDADGKLKPFSDPDLDSDQKGHGNDSRIHFHNCVECHVEGLRPFTDFVRDNLKEADFNVLDRATFKHLRTLYGSDLYGALARDRQQYADALARTNGLTPAQNAAAFRDLIARYAYEPVTLDTAAFELGCTADQLKAALERLVRDRPDKKAMADPILVALARGVPMRRGHFEERVSTLYDALAGNIR